MRIRVFFNFLSSYVQDSTKDGFFDIAKKKFESGFSLFKKRIKEITTILEDSYQKIKGINDTTKEDIERSKKNIRKANIWII
ncbi:conserved hypothetical protein (plasmid) [Borreliella burgdorferi WI91-23]|nr:conserved hypothetical protein [Borreliella burgdorferi WI91-23]